MLAEQNNAVHEVAVTMRELTADDKIRLQCEARERYERDRISLMENGVRKGMQQGLEQGAAKQKEIDEAILAEKDNVIKIKETEIEMLRQQLEEAKKQ